jgi:poly(3-hydroxybutyrate) depolymerase
MGGRLTKLALLCCSAVLIGGFAAAPAGAKAPSPQGQVGGGAGTVAAFDFGTRNGGIHYSYLVYTPIGWTRHDHWPLVVALHGCGSSSKGQMAVDRLNGIADREHFLVLRPDNGAGCWRAVSDDSVLMKVSVPGTTGTADITRGGGGDADIVADMTKRVIRAYRANSNRVYIMGFSSGAFQASATAAAYPDLFAGASSAEGGGPGMAITCVAYPQAVAPLYAAAAVEATGKRAHVMPFIAVAGDLDPIGEAGVAGCSRMAFWEWVSINNMLAPSPSSTLPSGRCAALPPQLPCSDTWTVDPSSTVTGQVDGGHTWTEQIATGSDGDCVIAQNWVVHGMGHQWSGGEPSNPDDGVDTQASDPDGPDLSQLAWNFFSRFSLKKEYSSTRSYKTACSLLRAG